MDNQNIKLVRIFTGTEVAVLKVKSDLESNGIKAVVRDEMETGMAAGFGAGTSSTVELFVDEQRLEEAKGMLNAD